MYQLTIRAEQMQAFRDAMLGRWLEQFLRNNYPEQCAGTLAGGYQEFLAVQIKRARSYGFITDNQIRNYVNVAFLLGGDFDRNTDYEWAQAILLDRDASPGKRVRALQEALLRHLDARASAVRTAAAGA